MEAEFGLALESLNDFAGSIAGAEDGDRIAPPKAFAEPAADHGAGEGDENQRDEPAD